MTFSTIEIKARSVQWTLNLAKHLYIIHTSNEDKKTILRAGPEFDRMLNDDLKVVYTLYNKENEKLFSRDWDPENKHLSIFKIQGTDIEMQNYMNKMWQVGEWINSEKYDYKLPIFKCHPLICPIQNSNTAVRYMTNAVGIDIEQAVKKHNIWVPGISGYLEHTYMDKFTKAVRDKFAYNLKHDIEDIELSRLAMELNIDDNVRPKENMYASSNRHYNKHFNMHQELDDLFDMFAMPEINSPELTNSERFRMMAEVASKEQEKCHANNIKGNEKPCYDNSHMFNNLANQLDQVIAFLGSTKTENEEQA